jgi:hypothetical protein
MNTIKIKEHFLSKNSTAYSLVTALSLHEILRSFKEYKCTVCALELTNDEKRKQYLTSANEKSDVITDNFTV